MEYFTEEAKKELERRKAKALALAEAWGGVKRVYKKNGDDFSKIGQCFQGAKIVNQPYGSYGEKNILVYAGTYSDDCSIAKTVYSDSEEAKKYQEEGRLINRGFCLHPYVALNASEIEELCKNRAVYYTEYAQELSQALDDLETVGAKLVELREEAKELCKKYKSASYVLETIYRERKY